MRIVIEIGEWEHECYGAAFERDSIVDINCLKLSGTHPSSTRLVESHHELTTDSETVAYRGRVADIAVVHADGSVEPIHRLPSGPALRGSDADDDGHLEQPWNDRPVIGDSDRFLLTLITKAGRKGHGAVSRTAVGLWPRQAPVGRTFYGDAERAADRLSAGTTLSRPY